MPKTHNLRRHRAAELLRLATNGPSFSELDKAPQKEAHDNYVLWSKSWLLPLLKDLVPELREKKEDV